MLLANVYGDFHWRRGRLLHLTMSSNETSKRDTLLECTYWFPWCTCAFNGQKQNSIGRRTCWQFYYLLAEVVGREGTLLQEGADIFYDYSSCFANLLQLCEYISDWGKNGSLTRAIVLVECGKENCSSMSSVYVHVNNPILCRISNFCFPFLSSCSSANQQSLSATWTGHLLCS